MLFNNIDMTEHMRIIDIRGRGLFNQELKTIRATGSNEDYVQEIEIPKRHIEIDYEIRAHDKESLRQKIDEVSPLLITKEMVPVVFPDEEDRTYYCQLDGVEEDREYHHIGIHRGTLFLLRDKYKYGPEQTYKLEDISTIGNKGTAEAEPIFELTAKKKATFAMVSLGAEEDSEYNLIGTPVDVDEEVVDTRNRLFEERGQTLDTWTSAGTKVDGKVSGELNTDNDGITVPDYGTGEGWHGPALMKEIEPIQDFEVEMMLRAKTERVNQTFRIEFYLFDENMNNLGKMAIMDKNDNMNRKKGEGRYGPKGDRYERYVISDKDYEYNTAKWFGMLRMTRIDHVMTFYITRVNSSNKHVKSLKKTVVVDDDLMGKLKYVQIHMGKHGDNPSARAPRILSIKAYELYEEKVDKTPYIIYPDDVITFDHKNENLLINGEPRNDLKNFGGSFFNLKRGKNELVVTPPGVFDSKVVYADKYL